MTGVCCGSSCDRIFSNSRAQLPTLDELRQKLADEAEDSETEKKGFASEAEERAFYRSRSERQGGQSANKV